MIVNSTFRAPGGLARHLLRVDTNECIRIRDDLSVGCALEVVDAVSDFAVLGRVRGVEKSLIHMSISPQRSLSAAQERTMCERLRTVYAIPHDHPMLVVTHEKPGETGRPAHYHIVMPRMKSDRRQIRDSFSRIKNERISIELEHAFDHPLNSGPNIASVRRTLDVERPDMRDAIANLPRPSRQNAKTTVGDKSAAADAGIDLPAFDRRVLDAWHAGVIGDADRLRAFGLALACGDRATMVVDLTSGFSGPLRRILNRESKKRGNELQLKERDVVAAASCAGPLPPLAPARREIVRASADQQPRKYRQARAIEDWVIGPSVTMTKPARTTTQDGAVDMPSEPEPSHRSGTIAAHLEIIRRHGRLMMESRRRAAEHAWRMAKIWRSRSLRDFVALAAAGVAIASGAGILVTIAAATLASEIAAARGRALTEEARAASASLKATRQELRAEMQWHFEKVRSARRFRLDDIPPEARIAVGYVHLAVAVGRTPAPEVVDALNRAAPGLAEKVITVAEYGTSAAVARILNRMYRPKDERARQALALFVSNATPQPWGPKRPVGRSRGRDR